MRLALPPLSAILGWTRWLSRLDELLARFRNRYRPELHYMRGSGPKSEARRDQGS